MRRNWNEFEENEVCCLYSLMLKLQEAGKLGRGKGKTTKSALVKMVADDIERSIGSVESKLMNVTFCRKSAGLPVVIGYKPLSNCSNSLKLRFPISQKVTR